MDCWLCALFIVSLFVGVIFVITSVVRWVTKLVKKDAEVDQSALEVDQVKRGEMLKELLDEHHRRNGA